VKWLCTLLLCIAATSSAADNPETLRLKNGVTFPHKKHQTYLKSDCKQCHRKSGEAPGRIEGFGKDVAHRLCRTCHAMKNAGPAACPDCHKKQML
jgi:hypothetical protein